MLLGTLEFHKGKKYVKIQIKIIFNKQLAHELAIATKTKLILRWYVKKFVSLLILSKEEYKSQIASQDQYN